MKRNKNVAKKSETQNKFKHLHTMCVLAFKVLNINFRFRTAII